MNWRRSSNLRFTYPFCTHIFDGTRSGNDVRATPRDSLLVSELQELVLAPDAIAKIEQRVHSLLGTLHDQARDAASARSARVNELNAEIGRLVDAIAQMDLSSALRDRLTAAEESLRG